MSEGPVSFGKPLAFLVLAACVGGGVYAYMHWPSHYEGDGWEIDFPNKWEAGPFNDPAAPGKVVAKGPLLEEGMEGVAWATVNRHGTLDWPRFVQDNVPGTWDKQEDLEIAHKKAVMFEYEHNETRYMGVGVARGDAVVICAIGCAKPFFANNSERFRKVLMSLRCER